MNQGIHVTEYNIGEKKRMKILSACIIMERTPKYIV